MRARSHLALALPALAALALSGASPSCQKLQPRELHIFHTNDLHSHLRASRVAPFDLGGLARLKTLLRDLRAKNANVLTLDAGDWSEGTWVYSNDLGANMLQALGRLGFDAAVVGNHDFLNGPSILLDAALQAPTALLAANWDLSAFPRAAELARRVPAFVVREINGMRVAVVGLTTFEPFYESFLAPVIPTNPIDVATRVVAEAQKQADLVVLLSHNPFKTNLELARLVPGVSAVISGHSHVKTPTAVLVKNAGRDVPVVESGEHGQFLGELVLWVDPQKRDVRFKSSRLIPVDTSIAEDIEMAAWVADQEARLAQRFGIAWDAVIAESDAVFPHQDTVETPLGNLVVDVLRETTGTDIALDQASLLGPGIPKGPLRFSDLHDVLPHLAHPTTRKEWSLIKWWVPGKDLALIVEAFMTATGIAPLSSPLGWLASSGMQIQWDPTAKPAVQQILVNGGTLEAERIYTVTLTRGFLDALQLAAGKLSLPLHFAQVQDTGIEGWRALVDAAKKRLRFLPADTEIGSRALSTRADWGARSSTLKWSPASQELSLVVGNAGLQPLTTSAQLVCWAGLADQPVVYGTDQQQWTELGRLALPAMQAQSWAQVHLKVAAPPSGRRVPVRCDIQAEQDPYAGNQRAEQVLNFFPTLPR